MLFQMNSSPIISGICLSDVSQRSSSSCQSVKKCARFRQFQEKVDEAGLVVFVLSNDFAKSRFTREQVSVFVCSINLIVIIATAATDMLTLF